MDENKKNLETKIRHLSDTIIHTFKSIIEYTKENENILSKYIEDYKIISAISETLEIKINTITECISNFEQGLFKDQIMPEIITFNELLSYSIERLKKSQDFDILMYIQVVEEANSMINTTLVNYNIRTISPEIGSIFNGKEHEVMMTEKKEGFQKGQIIKVTNHGYTQDGAIITRANVVVAR